MSVIRYIAALLISSSNNLISKIQVLIMKCSRPILGYKSQKYSTQRIIQELGWLTAYQLITKETILFVHKILYNSKPISIYELFTFSINETQNIRSIRKPMVRDYHQSQKAHRS